MDESFEELKEDIIQEVMITDHRLTVDQIEVIIDYLLYKDNFFRLINLAKKHDAL